MLPHLVLPSPKLTDSLCEIWSMIFYPRFRSSVEMIAIRRGIRQSTNIPSDPSWRKEGDVACCGTVVIQSFPFGSIWMTNSKYVSQRRLQRDCIYIFTVPELDNMDPSLSRMKCWMQKTSTAKLDLLCRIAHCPRQILWIWSSRIERGETALVCYGGTSPKFHDLVTRPTRSYGTVTWGWPAKYALVCSG